MSLNTDYTSETYNSFFTIAEIDSFMRIVSIYGVSADGWNQATDEIKEPYVLASVNYINGFKWKGERSTEIQVPNMAWPRTGLNYNTGENVTNTPIEIGYASACYILNIFNQIFDTNSQIESKSVGPVSISYKSNSTYVKPSDVCILQYVSNFWHESSLGSAARMSSLGLKRRL